jgi:hypothetical protein
MWLPVHGALEDAVLVVTPRWQSTGNPAALESDAIALIGSFAEANTFVRRQTYESATISEVATGMLEGDGPFAGHGHLVRFVIEAQGPRTPAPESAQAVVRAPFRERFEEGATT